MPEAMPPAGTPPVEGAAPAEGGGEDQFSALITNVTDGLTMTLDVFGSSGAPGADKIQQALELYKAGVSEAMSGGGAPAAPQAGPGIVSPNAGGAKAVPV